MNVKLFIFILLTGVWVGAVVKELKPVLNQSNPVQTPAPTSSANII